MGEPNRRNEGHGHKGGSEKFENGADEHGASPLTSDEQESPVPERPATPYESRIGAMNKPSQAEGDRETVEEDLESREERRTKRREEGWEGGEPHR